jgi:hypothetical protein
MRNGNFFYTKNDNVQSFKIENIFTMKNNNIL